MLNMAVKKKKVVKKKAPKKTKKVVRKKAPIKSQSFKKVRAKSKVVSRQARPANRKFRLVVRNLILFVILSILSYVLYTVSSSTLVDVFYFLGIIFGVISIALFIVLLALLFLKLAKK